MLAAGIPCNRLPFYSMPPVSFPLAMSCRGGVSLRIDIVLGSAGAERKRRRKRRRQAPGIGGEAPCICASGEGVGGFARFPRKARNPFAADMLARRGYGGLSCKVLSFFQPLFQRRLPEKYGMMLPSHWYFYPRFYFQQRSAMVRAFLFTEPYHAASRSPGPFNLY